MIGILRNIGLRHARIWQSIAVFSICLTLAPLVASAQRGAASPPDRGAARPATLPAKVNYYVIPIRGEIIGKAPAGSLPSEGHDAAFEDALRAARAAKAQYIVIYLNTGGGLVDAEELILRSIMRNSDLHFVAAANMAGSAGAVIAMACSDIVMTKGCVIGAAVTVGVDQDLPADVRAKYRAWHDANLRSPIVAAGNNNLLMRGMRELDLAIALDTRNGQRVITEIPVATARNYVASGTPDGIIMIKRPGKILALTADEAVDAGLCRAIVPEQTTGPSGILYADIGKALGFGPEWKQVGTADVLMKRVEEAAVYLDFLDTYGEQIAKDQKSLATVQLNIADARTDYLVAQRNRDALKTRTRSSAPTEDMIRAQSKIDELNAIAKGSQQDLARFETIRKDMVLKSRQRYR